MEKNTVVLSLEDYNELKNNEVNLDELTDAYDSKIEDILNGDSVELLEPVYFESGSGTKFKVKNGCNFYSANDTTKELIGEIDLLSKNNDILIKTVDRLEKRTLLDFILRR